MNKTDLELLERISSSRARSIGVFSNGGFLIGTDGKIALAIGSDEKRGGGPEHVIRALKKLFSAAVPKTASTVDSQTLKEWSGAEPERVECAYCKGTGKCSACGGTGSRSCVCSDCGDEHRDDCDLECGNCAGEGELDPAASPGRLAGVVVDRNRLALLLEAFSGPVEIRAESMHGKVPDSVLVFGPDRRGVLMGLAGEYGGAEEFRIP